MSAALVVSLVLGIVTAVSAWGAVHFLRRDDLSGWGILCAFLALLVGIFAVVFPAVTFGGRAVGATTCRNWGNQVGVPVQFRVLNWADTGTCFARTPKGRWIPSDSWFAYVRGSR